MSDMTALFFITAAVFSMVIGLGYMVEAINARLSKDNDMFMVIVYVAPAGGLLALSVALLLKLFTIA